MRRLFLSAGLTALVSATAFAGPPGPPSPLAGTVHPAAQTFGPGARIVLAPHTTATVRQLVGLALPTAGATPVERATAFLTAHRDALGLSHLRYTHRDTTSLPRGMGQVVRFDLSTIENLDIQDMSLSVRLDLDGRVRSYTSDALPFSLPENGATIDAETALLAAKARYSAASFGMPRLVVQVPMAHHAGLAWRVPVALIPLQAHFFVWVDATTGEVLRDAAAGFDQAVTRLPLNPTANTEVPR